jgi:hypothetical protein
MYSKWWEGSRITEPKEKVEVHATQGKKNNRAQIL